MDEKDFELIKNADFTNEDAILEVIYNCKSGIYDGTNEDDEMIIVSIENGVGIRITTFQHNGWTRIEDYDLAKDEFGQDYIIRSEFYEK